MGDDAVCRTCVCRHFCPALTFEPYGVETSLLGGLYVFVVAIADDYCLRGLYAELLSCEDEYLWVGLLTPATADSVTLSKNSSS